MIKVYMNRYKIGRSHTVARSQQIGVIKSQRKRNENVTHKVEA